MKRTCIAVVFALGVLLIAAPRVRAQVPVTDAGNLAQNIVTAAKTAQTVINTFEQIRQLQLQIQNQLQTLKSIDPTTFSGLQALLAQGQFTYAMLQGDLASIGYSISGINQNFNRLFPKRQADWRNVRYSEFNSYYDNWNNEITTSSMAAARAQSSISTLDANNQRIASILAASNSASTGEVRQLQLVNQQLAMIHAQLGSLVQNLATVGRVITTWTAGSVGEQMMSRERARRRLENYTSRGRPPRVLNRLP